MPNSTSHSPTCLSIDLEVDRESSRVFAMAAVRSDSDKRVCLRGAIVKSKIWKLDELSDGVDFVVGHNFLDFDVRHLRSLAPNLACLKKPMIDTLRLGPLAYPRNPYHHLVKHYKDPKFVRIEKNDPELDARLCLNVLNEQITKLQDDSEELVCIWHWLTTLDDASGGFDIFFKAIRNSLRPSNEDARDAMERVLKDRVCGNQLDQLLRKVKEIAWPLAYAVSWINVSGGNSVVPPWVLYRFPTTMKLVRQLRDTKCCDPACSWCKTKHNARHELKTWFGFDKFRDQPVTFAGQSMQQAIVERNLSRKHLLGILPTGTGKSICYQIPALSRHERLGSLTVIIWDLYTLLDRGPVHA